MSEGYILKVTDLAAGYSGHSIISHVSFGIRPGEIMALIGANGCGKTTLLRTVTGELPPISGRIEAGGRDISGASVKDMAKIMSIVMTGGGRPDYFTCHDMVSSGRYPYTGRLGRLRPEDREIIENAMKQTGTYEIRDRFIRDVSDGQRQLVMLARAVAQETKLMILDEPTNFLDIKHRLLFGDMLKRLARDLGIGVLMSMHELDLVRAVSDSVISLKDGGVFLEGETASVITKENMERLFGLDGMDTGRIFR